MIVQQIQLKSIYMKFTMNTIVLWFLNPNIKKYHDDSEYSSLYYTCYIIVKYSINKNDNPLVTIISFLFVLLQIVR